MVKAEVVQINWHDRKAVYSLDIQPSQDDGLIRLATAGGDNNIRVYLLLI